MTLVRETVLGQGTPFEMRLVTLRWRQGKAPTLGGPNFLNGPCGYSEILFRGLKDLTPRQLEWRPEYFGANVTFDYFGSGLKKNRYVHGPVFIKYFFAH